MMQFGIKGSPMSSTPRMQAAVVKAAATRCAAKGGCLLSLQNRPKNAN
jgi:hypothetical protein